MEKENQLAILVKESNLQPTKAKFILERFQHYFEMADEWTIKARAIKVTNPEQKAEMQMARAGRLFLKDQRLAVETSRKELKEEALREGKAIDGIANVLKALIVPIEEYLERQEKFVEIREEEKREAMRLEIEKRIEDERIAKEKADAEALVKANIENEKLKTEAIKREKEVKAEREKQEAILAKERAKLEAERKAIEDMARAEREKREEALTLERAKVEKARKVAEEKAEVEKAKEKAKTEAERKEKERLAEILKNQIECPFCHKRFVLDKSKKV